MTRNGFTQRELDRMAAAHRAAQPREGILSRDELPEWVKPREDTARQFSVFYRSGDSVVEYAADLVDDMVDLCASRRHFPTYAMQFAPMSSYVPPEVHIAVGAEAMRRLGGGR